MEIEFGANTDRDTFETVLGGLKGYEVNLTLRGRRDPGRRSLDAMFDGIGTTKSGMIGLKFTLDNGHKVVIDVDVITKLHIY